MEYIESDKVELKEVFTKDIKKEIVAFCKYNICEDCVMIRICTFKL